MSPTIVGPLDAQGNVRVQVTPAGHRSPLDRTSVSCTSMARTYAVPGRLLELGVGALARPDFGVTVYGRAN